MSPCTEVKHSNTNQLKKVQPLWTASPSAFLMDVLLACPELTSSDSSHKPRELKQGAQLLTQ